MFRRFVQLYRKRTETTSIFLRVAQTPRYASLFLPEREANANLSAIIRVYVVLLENSTCPIFLLTPSSNNLLLAAPVCATKERSLSILSIVIQCHVCGNVFIRKTCHLVVLLFYVLPLSDEGGMFMTKVIYLFIGGTLLWC